MNPSKRWPGQPKWAGVDWKSRIDRFAAANTDDGDPLLSVINLFDVSMVLVVALLLALVGSDSLPEVAARMSQHDITIVTNPGSPDMQMVIKRGTKLESLRATDQRGWGRGERLGTAYRLESGEVVYVPEAIEAEGRRQ